MNRPMQVMFPLAYSDEKATHFKNTVSSASQLPNNPKKGDMYMASGNFTLGTEQVEAGDMIIWNGSAWKIIQANIDGEDTVSNSDIDQIFAS